MSRPFGHAGRDSAGSERNLDHDPIVQGILAAISGRRLQPGVKLGEDELAAAFGTTRVQVRQALSHLASRRIVSQIPNRGAFVRRPDWAEAVAIFSARQVVEAAAIQATIAHLNAEGEARLMAHVDAERGHVHVDRWASLTLTADFHVLIAELSGNVVLAEFVKELVLRTSLVIATFERPGSPDCSPEAHPGIAESVLKRDLQEALATMRRHIDDIRNRLEPEANRPKFEDLASIFRSIGVRGRRSGRRPKA